MTPRFLLALFDSAYVLALASWVGSLLFFSFGAAPIVLRLLGVEGGGRYVAALLTRCYTWGAVSGAIALPAYLGVPLSFPELRGPLVGMQALSILAGTLIMLYAANSLTPAIGTAREAGPAGAARLERLQRRLMLWNAVALGIGIGLLIAFANRPLPRTEGIRELSPTARARAAYETLRKAEESARRRRSVPTPARPVAPRK